MSVTFTLLPSAELWQLASKSGGLMGFSITWCAVRENDANSFLEQLHLVPTDKTEELPESFLAMGRLDTGWRVLWCNQYGCSMLSASSLSALSHQREVLLCLVEEHCMASSAEFWSDGKRKWSISHEGENGPKGLSANGELPESFPAIRCEMEAEQHAAGGETADVDYLFEIPLKVAESLVGFKHDEDYAHLSDGHFTVLEQVAPKRGFLARLLGRGKLSD